MMYVAQKLVYLLKGLFHVVTITSINHSKFNFDVE